LGTTQPIFIIDWFLNSWGNGCCEILNDVDFTIEIYHSENESLHNKLISEKYGG